MSEDQPITGLDASPQLMAGLNLSQPRSKFSPYTMSQRNKRRQEVYRLHFQTGYSARKIAELMKVDKNTINADIELLYKQVSTQETVQFEYFFDRQMIRLATLRDDLLQYRDSIHDIDTKRAITAQIADLDIRMLQVREKVELNTFKSWHEVAMRVNEMAEKQNLNYRLTGIFEFRKVSAKGYNKISDILKKEGLGVVE